MSVLHQSWILGRRALREALRTPDSLIPTLFIPVFFLVVNTGQAGKVFPDDTPFLDGQNYAAFQLPVSMLLAASFGSAALYLVEEIEGGYFDKLRAAPISRSAIVLGRLYAEFFKSIAISTAMILIGFAFGVRIESGILGYLLLIAMISLWAVVFSGFLQLIALKSRSAAATNAGGLIFFPLLFLTPNFVPRENLTRPMEIAASFNPVTYLMEAIRSLVIEGFEWDTIGKGFVVIAGGMALMLFLSVRLINNYD
jgi:ABC-2 type transport system permease protein